MLAFAVYMAVGLVLQCQVRFVVKRLVGKMKSGECGKSVTPFKCLPLERPGLQPGFLCPLHLWRCDACRRITRRCRERRKRWSFRSSSITALMPLANSAALSQESSDGTVSEAEPLGHQPDHVGKQSLAQCRIAFLNTFKFIDFENVKHARNLSLDGRTSHLACDQPHFANRRVSADTAYVYLATVSCVDG